MKVNVSIHVQCITNAFKLQQMLFYIWFFFYFKYCDRIWYTGRNFIGELMEGLNKFKVLTVVIILMFIFVVAAIYTNTKDVSEGKIKVKNAAEKEQFRNDIRSDMTSSENASNTEVGDLARQVEMLNRRLDEMRSKIDENGDNSSNGSCNVYGIVTENGVEQLSVSAALQEARDNGRELVLTCSF